MGHAAGAHNHLLPRPSRMTPTEAALYLGVPNICMVCFGNQPQPPFDRECLAMSTMKSVIWSIVGDASSNDNAKTLGHLDEILRLSRKFDNIHGVIFDDFFEDSRRRIYTPKVLSNIHHRLNENSHTPLSMWTVLYDHQLLPENQAAIDAFDGVTFWTWKGSDLAHFPANFHTFCTMTPGKRRMLGCYLYNYGEQAFFTRDDMARQLDAYAECLSRGEAEGIILLSNTVCDLELEAVAYARDWIALHGNDPV